MQNTARRFSRDAGFSLVEMLFSLSVSTYILNTRLIEDVRDKYPDNADFFTDERQQKNRSKAKDKIGAALLPITVVGKWLKLPPTATSFQRALIMDTDEPPF